MPILNSRATKVMLITLAVLAALYLAMLVANAVVPPPRLGLQEGRLQPCPDSPNCVCSLDADETHQIEPLASGEDVDAALAQAAEILESWPRTRIIKRTNDYLHAEHVSLIMRYVDDLELHVDRQASVIHIRSASRIGHSDLGVNRERVARLREALLNSPDR